MYFLPSAPPCEVFSLLPLIMPGKRRVRGKAAFENIAAVVSGASTAPVAAAFVTFVNCVSAGNAPFMEVTLSGIVTLVSRFSRRFWRNAFSPMEVTLRSLILSGMTTAFALPVYLVIVTVPSLFAFVVKSPALLPDHGRRHNRPLMNTQPNERM
jgi:hypothetical protein